MASEKNGVALNNPQTHTKLKLVPPDGGWGWMVLIGTALSNIFNQSMLSLFSLLYGDALEMMGHRTQGAAIVLSTMLFVTNFGGPIAGALQKLTSSRFVAVLGASFCTLGIFFSAFSTNIVHLIITYGILLGAGLGFIQNASFVAINSYFTSKKSRAVGLANVGTGIGQTLMPHVVRYLLEGFGFKGACLILSALSLHGIAGTLLIHPVEWHWKEVEEEVPVNETLRLLEKTIHKDSKTVSDHNRNRRSTEPNVRKDLSRNNLENFKSQSEKEFNLSKISIAAEHNGNVAGKLKSPQNKSTLKKLFELFDISLLSSPRFLNIIIGTALSVTSIQNFSMLFPFFLQKVAHMDKRQTALCMSAVASADIAGRLILPIFQDKFRIKARWMLIMTCVWLIVTRQILAYQTDLTVLIVMSSLYGFGRSMVIVARNIAISEQCRPEQVPAAVGLGMFTMGIIVPPAGYFLGWIRDYTGSYGVAITAQNILLVVVLVTWIPDMLVMWAHERKETLKKQHHEIS